MAMLNSQMVNQPIPNLAVYDAQVAGRETSCHGLGLLGSSTGWSLAAWVGRGPFLGRGDGWKVGDTMDFLRFIHKMWFKLIWYIQYVFFPITFHGILFYIMFFSPYFWRTHFVDFPPGRWRNHLPQAPKVSGGGTVFGCFWWPRVLWSLFIPKVVDRSDRSLIGIDFATSCWKSFFW